MRRRKRRKNLSRVVLPCATPLWSLRSHSPSVRMKKISATSEDLHLAPLPGYQQLDSRRTLMTTALLHQLASSPNRVRRQPNKPNGRMLLLLSFCRMQLDDISGPTASNYSVTTRSDHLCHNRPVNVAMHCAVRGDYSLPISSLVPRLCRLQLSATEIQGQQQWLSA